MSVPKDLKDLYLFDLPADILNSLVVVPTSQIGTVKSTTEDQPTNPAATATSLPNALPHTASTAARCHTCALEFESVTEQRAHVKSDWHRYNLKLRLQHRPTVTEEHFDTVIADLAESISGSDTDYDTGAESGADEDRELSGRIGRLAVIPETQAASSTNSQDNGGADKLDMGHAPIVWFRTSAISNSSVVLGVWKSIFKPEQLEAPESLVEAIRRQQIKPYTGPDFKAAIPPADLPSVVGPTYFLCMLGGGHFAAMIVALSGRTRKNPKSGMVERVPVVIAHRSFHRYTTRRKQGGSQSANDNAKGTAHSAGSGLRRHNEAALITDIRNLMEQWKGAISAASHLFLRTGRIKWTSIFGADSDPVIGRSDCRIRKFPFTTRRATQAELIRAFTQLTRLSVSSTPESTGVDKKADSGQKKAKPSDRLKADKPTAVPALSLEEQELVFHTSQLTNMIKRAKAPAVLSYLTSNELSATTFRLSSTTDPFAKSSTMNQHTPTLLHLAAHLGAGAVVIALLTRANADPTVTNGDGKTAFQLADDSHTQDAFRIARHELGEDVSWNWPSSRIPVGVARTEIEIAKQAKLEQEKKEKAAKTKEREEQEQKLRLEAEEAARKARFGHGKTIGGMVRTAKDIREADSRGLTPDMQRRLERERRIKAIEERMGRRES